MTQRPPRRHRPRRTVVGVAIGAPAALAVLLALTAPAAAYAGEGGSEAVIGADGSGASAPATAAAPTAASAPDAPTPAASGSADSDADGTSGPGVDGSHPTPTDPIEIASPTITRPGGGLVSGPVTITGTRASGDTIRVTIDGAGSGALCTAPTNGTDTWSCAHVTLPDSPDVTIRATAVSEPTRSATLTVPVLSAPQIDGATRGGIVSSGAVDGTGYPGARVTAQLAGGSACTATVDTAGTWSCVLARGTADGTYPISARQIGPAPFPAEESKRSAAVPFTLDTVAPPAPSITSPTAGTQLAGGSRVVYRGTGVSGSMVTVWAATRNGSLHVCTTEVTGGTWRCTGARLRDGEYVVSAVQADAAQNTSAASASVPVRFTTTTSGPSSNAPTAPGSDASSPPPSRDRTPAPNSGQTSAPHASPTPQSPHGAPSTPETIPPQPPLATPFTAAVQPVFADVNGGGWVTAALMALAALLLVAMPARMLAGTVVAARGGSATPGVAAHSWRLLGRNRAAQDIDDAPVPETSSWTSTVFGVAFSTIVVAIAMPDSPDTAAARLLPAILIAVATVNAVAIGASRIAARAFTGVTTPWHFSPALLLAVAGASVASRLLGLEPALLFGVVVAVAAQGGTARTRGIASAAGPTALAALAAAGWLVISVLPDPTTVATAFIAELLNALVLLAIGSAAIALVPIGNGPGRALFLWSTGRWVILTLVVDTLLFAILAPTTRLDALGNVLLFVALIAFAAVSIALWVWRRFVAPALR